MGKGLSPEQLVRRVREAAEPVIASFDLMLWGIEVVSGGRTVVRVYVDAPAGSSAMENGSGEDGVLEGVSVDHCAEISRMVGLALDVDEVFSDAWVLEVSSPGMDRLFFEPSQLASYAGRELDVMLSDPHPDIAGRRKFRGPLVSVAGDSFVMEVLLAPAEGEKPAPSNVSIRWDWVRKARLVPVFPDTSKPGAGKNAKKAAGKGGGKQA
ncbi:ribosome maturation factor [uncultured Mailhella sp.]|uniref:ribosome maturation factor n=1 Tax=uncultured Mailhella sp. TaxID=1981031 RepID=UPI0025E595EF|nr:ribosome maturation factor [uncultured Mailhella sp.]